MQKNNGIPVLVIPCFIINIKYKVYNGEEEEREGERSDMQR